MFQEPIVGEIHLENIKTESADIVFYVNGHNIDLNYKDEWNMGALNHPTLYYEEGWFYILFVQLKLSNMQRNI